MDEKTWMCLFSFLSNALCKDNKDCCVALSPLMSPTTHVLIPERENWEVSYRSTSPSADDPGWLTNHESRKISRTLYRSEYPLSSSPFCLSDLVREHLEYLLSFRTSCFFSFSILTNPAPECIVQIGRNLLCNITLDKKDFGRNLYLAGSIFVVCKKMKTRKEDY